MSNIKMKIKGVQGDSLLISFSSEDETPDLYPPCAYQISMFGADMPKDEMLKKIAQSGFVQVQMQNKRKDPKVALKVAEFESMVGEEIVFQEQDIFSNASQTVEVDTQAAVEEAKNIFKTEVIAIIRELGLTP